MTRMHAARLILVGLVAACVCAPLSAIAQPRTWGFDRDTVREWSEPPLNGVNLVNSGTDTLRIDTLRVEPVAPIGVDSFDVAFIPPSASVFYFWDPGVSGPGLGIRVPPGQTGQLRRFQIERAGVEMLAKQGAVPDYGDTLLLRLRFVAQGGVEDTLMGYGVVEGSWNTALRFRSPGMKRSSLPSGPPRDLRGRVQPASRPISPLFQTP